jgi:hypothetical protein
MQTPGSHHTSGGIRAGFQCNRDRNRNGGFCQTGERYRRRERYGAGDPD